MERAKHAFCCMEDSFLKVLTPLRSTRFAVASRSSTIRSVRAISGNTCGTGNDGVTGFRSHRGCSETCNDTADLMQKAKHLKKGIWRLEHF